MALSGAHLDELVAELAELAVGRRIREVAPLPPCDLLLILEPEADGPLRRLLVSASADGPRLHLQIGPRQAHRGPLGPFFRAALERLPGRSIRRIARIADDRIVRIDGAGQDGRRGETTSLVAELTGRHSNLILLDGSGRIVAVLVPPKQGSRHAERLALGAAWEPPRGGVPPPGDGQSLAETLPAAPVPERNRDLAERAPLSWRVEAALGSAASTARRTHLAADLARRLKRRMTQARARLAGLHKERESAALADAVQRDGELLLAQHARVSRGQSSIEVVDSYEPDAPRRTIRLDPKRTVRENAERLFARAKKRRRAQSRLPAEIELQVGFVAAIEGLAERLRAGADEPDLLEEEAVASGLLPKRQADDERRKTAPAPRLPYRVFTGSAGSEIWVGRSARDNDALSLRHSRGNDLWLHTAEAPGSHVVLRLERGGEPDPDEVIDAAHLAIHFSPLRDARKADVHIARCKEVRKPKGAPAGLVILKGGKNRAVRIEPERLARLLGRHPG